MEVAAKNVSRTAWRVRFGAKALALLAGAVFVTGLTGCVGGAAHEVKMPKDLPGAVQIAEGTILSAGKSGGAWNVSVELGESDSRENALKQLEKRDFKIIGESESGGKVKAYSFANAKYSVRVGVTEVKGKDVLNYTIAERQGGGK
ncbi:hypothetical protein [Leucobacter iarius]|uniref:Lipoprotein n=1 Tax=Leucobacter iarius TaxID=333963 RepID=A0ABN2L7N3_9MICO